MTRLDVACQDRLAVLEIASVYSNASATSFKMKTGCTGGGAKYLVNDPVSSCTRKACFAQAFFTSPFSKTGIVGQKLKSC